MDKSVSFKDGKVIAKNVFAQAAMTNCQSNPDGTLHENELKWLERRAKGGYGIITTCCVHVQENGKGWEGEWAIFDDKHTDGYKLAADTMHKHGSLLIVQVFHCGMRADPALIPPNSAVTCVDTVYKSRAGDRPAKGMTEAEIQQLIDDHVAAAKRLESAGVDGIEIHGAHGYLLTQFLCPDLNTRTDKWGGKSLENRVRLTREILKAIKANVSDKFIVGIRLSPEPGYEKAGWNMDPDEHIQICKWLVEDDKTVDFISISIFGHSPTHIAAKHKEIIPDDTTPLIKKFRDVIPSNVILMCCGGITSANDVQTLLDLGVDVVATASTAISTPDFPNECISNSNFTVSVLPPYEKEFLSTVDVSEKFIEFLDMIGKLKH